MKFEEAREIIESLVTYKDVEQISFEDFEVNDVFESIVESDADTSSTEYERKKTVRWTLLHVAVQAANVSAVKFLLAKGADFSLPYKVTKNVTRERPLRGSLEDWSEWKESAHKEPSQSAFEIARDKATCDSRQEEILKLFKQYKVSRQIVVAEITKFPKALASLISKYDLGCIETKPSFFPPEKRRKVGISQDAYHSEPTKASDPSVQSSPTRLAKAGLSSSISSSQQGNKRNWSP